MKTRIYVFEDGRKIAWLNSFAEFLQFIENYDKSHGNKWDLYVEKFEIGWDDIDPDLQR